MNNIETLHERYAKALFATSKESDSLDRVMRDLEKLVGILRSNQDLLFLLKHPEISKEEKIIVLEEISKKNKFSDDIVHFLRVLIRKNRGDLLHGVFLRFRDYYDVERKRVKVFVESAVELTKTQTDKLIKRLRKYLEEEIVLDIKIKPSLIGGLSVRLHNKIYDTSVLNILKDVNKRL